LKTNSDRVQKRSTARRTVQAIGWVPKPISCQIDQKAYAWGVTRSKAIAMLVERGLMQDVFAKSEKILTDAVERAVSREERKGRTIIVGLLFRILTVATQLLQLVIHLLARGGSVTPPTPEKLDQIIAWSREQARAKVMKRLPETEALHKAIGDWLETAGQEPRVLE
jgi:hypothetical protein